MIFVKNAIIESAKISNDDHGMLSAWLFLDYGDSGQGFGGFALYLPDSFTHHRGQANYAGHFIWQVLKVADVTEWASLPGKSIRVRKFSEWDTIRAIGHIVRDIWFDPSAEFSALKAALGNGEADSEAKFFEPKEGA